jgi:D-alanyl-D-alanine carboxypeptidase (penicillin-binding protein 5/6)
MRASWPNSAAALHRFANDVMRSHAVLNRRVLLLSGAAAAMVSGAAAAQGIKKVPPAGARAALPKPPVEPAATGSPAQTPVGPLDTAAPYAIIIDYNTGATLLDKDADEPMTPSSMTKLMTAYIVYGMLKAGRLKLDQELPVSERAWRMGGSKMFVQIGTQVKVEDLIRGMIVQSGNDACIVLAEGIAGSEEQFVELMNAKARELGLTHSTFRNTTGWPDPNHQMSARDIAMLARRLIQDYPEFYRYDSEKSFRYNNIEQENRNPLVQKGLADGLKTGHTDEAGYGLVASAIRGGRRVILVLNGLTSMHQRGEESERLLEWAFREFEDVTLFTAGDVVEQAPVWLGAAPVVPLVGGRDLAVTMPRGWRNKARVTLAYETPIRAPVLRGTTLGRLTISGDGVPDMSIPLLAGADVPRLGLPGRAMAVLSHYVTGG